LQAVAETACLLVISIKKLASDVILNGSNFSFFSKMTALICVNFSVSGGKRLFIATCCEKHCTTLAFLQ